MITRFRLFVKLLFNNLFKRFVSRGLAHNFYLIPFLQKFIQLFRVFVGDIYATMAHRLNTKLVMPKSAVQVITFLKTQIPFGIKIAIIDAHLIHEWQLFQNCKISLWSFLPNDSGGNWHGTNFNAIKKIFQFLFA